MSAVINWSSLVEAYHHHEISAGRVACEIDFIGRAAVFCHVFDSPGSGGSSIVDTVDGGDRGVNLVSAKTVIHGHNTYALILQFAGNEGIAAGEASAVIPYHNGEVLYIGRIVEIELTSLF